MSELDGGPVGGSQSGDYTRAQDTARVLVTKYLTGGFASTLDDAMAVVLNDVPTQVALLLTVLVGGIGDIYGDVEDWSKHVVDSVANRRTCSRGHLLDSAGDHWFAAEAAECHSRI